MGPTADAVGRRSRRGAALVARNNGAIGCARRFRRPVAHAPDGSGVQISLPIATAVSIMRFEKPHSLSYQDSTLTSLPSITLVWSR